MAKVEMDLSEYQEIQKNKELLEKSLGRERELSDKLDRVNEEKINAFKSNEKLVTIINRKVSSGRIRTRRSVEDCVKSLQDLIRTKGSLRNITDSEYDSFIDSFFEVQEYNTENETVTRRGFDEVKKKVKKEYLKELKGVTETKLQEREDLLESVEKIKLSFSESQISVRVVTKDFNSCKEELKLERERFLKYKDEVEVYKQNVTAFVNQPINILNYNSYKKRLTLID